MLAVGAAPNPLSTQSEQHQKQTWMAQVYGLSGGATSTQKKVVVEFDEVSAGEPDVLLTIAGAGAPVTVGVVKFVDKVPGGYPGQRPQ